MDFSLKEIVSFLSIVLLLVMFPGPNTVLIMHSVGVNGKKSGFLNVAGIVTALYFHAIIAAVGLSVILTQSTQLYMSIKYLGALYILYLGLTSIYSSCFHNNQKANQLSEITNRVHIESLSSSFYRGLISNILNPKVALFYLSFIPQFVHNQSNFLTESLFLTFLYSLISASWYSLLVICIDKFQIFFEQENIRQRIKVISGLFLVGLSIKMAVENK
ncbi:LysE family translocator [Desulforamulus aquiferis]|uniref:LysE family translocator n=1 Tax=Desulforamulus aquiferis TaxID=1397668 RepID=A0AAW7ZD72_9FIRM|nr:LysE family translocator [Desulforamulus aquiferis]MDO7787228.1 LysE family translocator [Desulforamulus aquiferis]